MSLTRVTVSLDRGLLEEARALSGGNFSRFVSGLVEERIEEDRRRRLREALRAGYEAEAEHDLEIVGEYRFVDAEVAYREEA